MFISARGAAGLTQRALARKMKTSQAYIARLESGKEKPSTRTLERFAKATGHRVMIDFEPVKKGVKAGQVHVIGMRGAVRRKRKTA